MDSKELITQLEASFMDLSDLSLEMRYSGALDEIASDLTMADTFIAGIAHTILSGKRPPTPHIAILRQALPLEGHLWKRNPDQVINLADYPEILHYARIIDQVRNLSLQLLLDPNFVPERRLRPASVERLLNPTFPNRWHNPKKRRRK